MYSVNVLFFFFFLHVSWLGFAQCGNKYSVCSPPKSDDFALNVISILHLKLSHQFLLFSILSVLDTDNRP